MGTCAYAGKSRDGLRFLSSLLKTRQEIISVSHASGYRVQLSKLSNSYTHIMPALCCLVHVVARLALLSLVSFVQEASTHARGGRGSAEGT